MDGFVCVYRRPIPTYSRKPSPTHFELTKETAAQLKDRNLRNFLRAYLDDDCYYDWGDDPAFYAAETFVGDIRMATWGVCRGRLPFRKNLKMGDLIIFFLRTRART